MTAMDSVSTQAAEPFIGDELISVIMSCNSVELHFARDILQIGGQFILQRPGCDDELIEPARKLGAVQALWHLIGHIITSTRWGTDWGDTVELTFGDIALIRILPVSAGFRGTIMGKFPPSGTLQIEDF